MLPEKCVLLTDCLLAKKTKKSLGLFKVAAFYGLSVMFRTEDAELFLRSSY